MVRRLSIAWALRGCCPRDVGRRRLLPSLDNIVEGLYLGASPSNDLGFLDLEHPVDDHCVWIGHGDDSEVATQLLAVFFVLLIHVEHEFLGHVARLLVLVVEAGGDA